MSAYRILAFDGGGIKGLFTATVLQELRARYPRLFRYVKLFAGTSTGGIIALALAANKSPDDLVRLYTEEGPIIFGDSMLDQILDLGNAIGAQYSNKNLKKVLRNQFGSLKLKDLSRQVLIPTFDLNAEESDDHPQMWKPKFFHNYPGNDSDGNETVVDVAVRTSSAPTYFPSYQGYIDGGVIANNPALAALATALDERAGDRTLEEILLLSIGTGTHPTYIEGNKKDWGWSQWAKPIVDVMFSGSVGVADFQCRQILGETHYHRIDGFYDRRINLDTTDAGSLAYLMDAARAVNLDGAVQWLTTNSW